MLEQTACPRRAPELRPGHIVAQEAQTKLDRCLDAVEKGMGPVFTSNAREQPKPSWRPPKAVIEAYGTSIDFVLVEDQLTYPAESAAFSASR